MRSTRSERASKLVDAMTGVTLLMQGLSEMGMHRRRRVLWPSSQWWAARASSPEPSGSSSPRSFLLQARRSSEPAHASSRACGRFTSQTGDSKRPSSDRATISASARFRKRRAPRRSGLLHELEQLRRNILLTCQLTNLEHIVEAKATRGAQRPFDGDLERRHVENVEAADQLLRLGERSIHDRALALSSPRRARPCRPDSDPPRQRARPPCAALR